jgi:hypothetical protein
VHLIGIAEWWGFLPAAIQVSHAGLPFPANSSPEEEAQKLSFARVNPLGHGETLLVTQARDRIHAPENPWNGPMQRGAILHWPLPPSRK